ncbi:MAG: energy transducer TonB [Bacteroidota bacterium]
MRGKRIFLDSFVVIGLIAAMVVLHAVPKWLGVHSVDELKGFFRTRNIHPAQLDSIKGGKEPVERMHYRVAAEEMPIPLGGESAIQANLVYPDVARRLSIEGTVYVLAYVDSAGTVVSTSIIHGIGGGCDEAASDAVSKIHFAPGREQGKPVAVKVMIPVRFSLATNPQKEEESLAK